MVDLENLKDIENENILSKKEDKADSEDGESSTSPKSIFENESGKDNSLKRPHGEINNEINTKKLKSSPDPGEEEDSEMPSDIKIAKKKVKKKLKKLTTNQLEDMMAEIAVEYLTTNKCSLGKMRQEMLSYKADMIKYEQEFSRLKELQSELTSELRECTEWAERNNTPIRHKKVRNVGVQKNKSSKSSEEPIQKSPQPTKATNSQQINALNAQSSKLHKTQKSNGQQVMMANGKKMIIANGQKLMMANGQNVMMVNGQQVIRMKTQPGQNMNSQQRVILNSQQSKIGNIQPAFRQLLVKRANTVNAIQTKHIHEEQNTRMNTQQNQDMREHDPLALTPMQSTLKLPPPRLFLKVEGDLKGIYVTWTFNGSMSEHAPIQKYQLFVDPQAAKVNPEWKKIGDIGPKPLPMKCTITYNNTFTTDQRYHFKIRATDVHNREGEFSNIGSICISSYGISY